MLADRISGPSKVWSTDDLRGWEVTSRGSAIGPQKTSCTSFIRLNSFGTQYPGCTLLTSPAPRTSKISPRYDAPTDWKTAGIGQHTDRKQLLCLIPVLYLKLCDDTCCQQVVIAEYAISCCSDTVAAHLSLLLKQVSVQT